MYAMLVKFKIFSTISTFTPLVSTSADVYPLPPPTTLVGALSYPYVKHKHGNIETYNGTSSSIILLNKIVYASAGVPLDAIFTISKAIERTYQQVYMRKAHWKRLDMAYTISIRPVIYIDEIYGLYIIKEEALELVKYAYGIIRIGRKESLVSVNNVIIRPVNEIIVTNKRCLTKFYFPLTIARSWGRENIDGAVYEMPVLNVDNFSRSEPKLDKFVVPLPYSIKPIDVVLNENGVIIKINGLYIPIPRGVIYA